MRIRHTIVTVVRAAARAHGVTRGERASAHWRVRDSRGGGGVVGSSRGACDVAGSAASRPRLRPRLARQLRCPSRTARGDGGGDCGCRPHSTARRRRQRRASEGNVAINGTGPGGADGGVACRGPPSLQCRCAHLCFFHTHRHTESTANDSSIGVSTRHKEKKRKRKAYKCMRGRRRSGKTA